MSKIRISASRLKTLCECSLKTWYAEIERLPESVHWKATVGVITHKVFEMVLSPHHLPLFKRIILGGPFDIASYPSLSRYTARLLRQHGISDRCTVADIGALLDVAWLGIRRHFVTEAPDGSLTYTPPPRWYNEKRFQITLPSGAVISGFIDLLILWGKEVDGVFVTERAIVIDLKSAAAKFTKAYLPNDVQAGVYAMVCQREEGFIPAVEFIMLRHPPSKRYPSLHIQRVEPPSMDTLAGLQAYVEMTYTRLNGMSFEEALSHCSQDSNYCQFKCGYLRPFVYWVVLPKGTPEEEWANAHPLSSHLVLDEANEKAHTAGHIVTERSFGGCFAKWRQ